MGIIQQNDRQFEVFVSVNKDSGMFNLTDQNGNAEQVEGVSGILKDIKREKGSYKNSTIEFDKLIFTIQDDKTYKVQMGFNTISARGLVNSLLTADKLYNQDISIKLYKKDESQKYSSTSLRLAGERLAWSYNQKDVPDVEITTLKSGKTVEDDTARIDFYDKKFATLVNKLNLEKGNAGVTATTHTNDEEPF